MMGIIMMVYFGSQVEDAVICDVEGVKEVCASLAITAGV